MDRPKRKFSLGTKIYVYIIATILIATFGVGMISYVISVNQINNYYKRLTLNTAEYFSNIVDSDYLRELKEVVKTEEFQELRKRAEEEEDDSIIVDYLTEKGLWEMYLEQRNLLIDYVQRMSDVKYLYIIVCNKGAKSDMYLLDADDLPYYQTGSWEERESDFHGADFTKPVDPVISDGDWGWLCSGYYPIYDSQGTHIANVGCDVDMEDVMGERQKSMIMIISSAFGVGLLFLIIAVIYIKKKVVKPLNDITHGMERFTPGGGRNYRESGVINLNLDKNDEIGDIYREIKSMQTRIVDYVNDLSAIQNDKKKAEEEIRNKEKEIGQVAKDAYKDPLTGVGSKSAYNREVAELNARLENGPMDFAILMVDANNLKKINDNYGHSAGDTYLKGVSRAVREVFRRSTVYRVGGDEFVAILTGSDFRHREERIEELRNFYENSYLRKEKNPWYRYSAAVGVAVCTPEDRDVDTIFKRADEDMYEKKIKLKQWMKEVDEK